MSIISNYAREKKISYFFQDVPIHAKILEIGCGDGWVKQKLNQLGYENYVSLDLYPPADIVGNIKDWEQLGLEADGYDIIIAFELVEHVDCFDECFSLLKKGGKMLITTPVPHMDWFLRMLEFLNLNQKRTSPHNNLLYIKKLKDRWQGEINVKYKIGLSQWGTLIKGL